VLAHPHAYGANKQTNGRNAVQKGEIKIVKKHEQF